MSSKKNKAARRSADVLEETPAQDADLPTDPTARRRLVSYRQKQRALEHHEADMVHLRDTRRQSSQNLDGMETANEDREWKWETMVDVHLLDASGTPVLREDYAMDIDLTAEQRRSARYWRAYRALAPDRPAQAAAYFALFHRLPYIGIDAPAQETAAARLHITPVLFRARLWKAHKEMTAACAEVLPARVVDYAAARATRISRQARARRAAHWQRIHEGHGL